MSTRRSPWKSQARFAVAPQVGIPRSSLDRTHNIKTTFNAGLLIPILVDEILPGDTISCRLNHFARLSTPRTAIFDNMWMEFFFFFIPNRLVWENWQAFMGERKAPDSSIDFEIPTVTPALPGPGGGFQEGSMGDYFGLPTKIPNLAPNALFFRSYNLVWGEWFRDQNLQDPPSYQNGDGPDAEANYPLRRRGKRHDYYTSSLPAPQKGDPILLPLGTQAPLVGYSNVVKRGGSATGIPIFENASVPGGLGGLEGQHGASVNLTDKGGTWSSNAEMKWSDPQLRADHSTSGGTGDPPYADLTQATAVSINNLREAAKVQQLLERDMRSGTRYVELLRGHFGIRNHPDARLQRPEYLGGGSSRIVVHPVTQTSQTTSGAQDPSPQGTIAAYGTSTGRAGFTKSFVEHGTLLGLVAVRADLNYQQGLHRMWSRKYRYDFFWPEFQNLGEQAVLSQEIYADGSGTPEAGDGDYSIWGYQERYAEYRFKPNTITGLFRSNSQQPLDVWHLAQNFSERPMLDATFIEENPPVDRVVAVTNQPHILFDGYVQYRCARPMPMYSVPGITRF